MKCNLFRVLTLGVLLAAPAFADVDVSSMISTDNKIESSEVSGAAVYTAAALRSGLYSSCSASGMSCWNNCDNMFQQCRVAIIGTGGYCHQQADVWNNGQASTCLIRYFVP